MEWLLDLRIIRFFSFYLAVIFLISTFLRLQQYRSILSLVTRLHSRWPRLTKLVVEHRNIFLTQRTVFPLLIVLVLLGGNLVASRWIWPLADRFDLRNLLDHWLAIPFILLSGIAMVVFDIVGVCRVGRIDDAMLEQYFDQAEFWLKGWKAPVVKVLSLGYINPMQMVNQEVRSALHNATQLLNTTLWWVTIQTSLRILFGLCIWTSYALQHWNRPLTP